MSTNLNELIYKLGYRFKDEKILKEAITHDSLRSNDLDIKHYERLEHLGDAVLQMVITEYLFKTFSDASEGTLSLKRADMVCRVMQTKIANELQLNKYIHKSPGVEEAHFRRYDKFVEAIVGAVYVDAGFGERGLNKAKTVIFKLWKIQEPNKSNDCAIM